MGCFQKVKTWLGFPGSKIQAKATGREKGRVVECGEQDAGTGETQC